MGRESCGLITSLITILFVIFYVSSGFVGGSKLLETMFGIKPTTGVLFTFLAIASYTLIGGFLAVSRTDVFQALLVLISLLIIAGALFVQIDHPISAFGADPATFLNPFVDSTNRWEKAFSYMSAAGWGLGAFGAQRVIQRFMALAKEDGHIQSRNISVRGLQRYSALQ